MRVPEYLLWPSIVVLLLPALRGVQAGKCPRVCVCDSKKLTIACVGKNLTQVPPTIDEITVKLDLRRNVLGELVRAAFTDTPYLTHLDLRRCRIHTVREGAFRGLARLVQLHLTYNDIDILHQESFDGLSSLKHLFLDHNRIEEIRPGAFSQMGSLKLLSLAHNRLIYIPNMGFQGLLNLRMLRLSHNSLNNLDTEAFAGLLSLTRLSLDHNELQFFPTATMSRLVALTHLDFSSNPMTYLGEMSVSMAKLTHLSLAHMALQDLSVAALSLSPHLSHLDLSHNQLHYLQPLTGPSQLRSLNLTANALWCTCVLLELRVWARAGEITLHGTCSSPPHLSDQPLEGVLEQDLRCRRQDGVRRAEEEEEEWGTQTVVTAAPKRNDKCPENCLCEPEAQHVSCEERSLTKVPRGFHANTLLLDMRGNHFHYLPSNSFRDVPKVVSLHLDGCKIQEVLDGAFRGLKELIYLYLSNNELSSLGSSVFAGTQQLMYLHLDGNRLSQFPSVAMLAHVPKLQELHLERNRITKLEPAGLLSPIPTLRGLYLTNNSISTAVPKALDPASNLEILHLGANELAEVPIDVLGHAPRLIELCLSGNTIHWIAPKAFQEVGGSLMHLYLDGQGLKKMSQEALAGLGPALLSLSLEGNQLENLPDLSPLTGLRHLTLYGNPLMCDCSLLPLHRWMEQTGVNLSAVCGYPAELRGQNVMEVDVFRNCTTEKHYTATNSTNLRKTVQTTKPKPMLPSAVTGNPPKRKHRPTKTKPLVKPSKSDSTKSGKSESSLKKNKIVL
ncbi:chondroadherin-like protein [Electrophorus electricus]|uniref:chondroadherin-like protein n=1 Tax=Electrophorus electricus TaxID=8005 RepID=UPI0015D08F0B|nr:chondroadherin-like protein [Electrophorus electricus]XP_026875998.2 chondroadherin-like protein [Electrophorus electricus]